MINIDKLRKLVLSFPGTEENPHFERSAFKVTGKRIFLTLLEADLSANILLTPDQQEEMREENGISPVPNKWGLQGWTTFDLKTVSYENFSAATTIAYENVLSSGGKSKKK